MLKFTPVLVTPNTAASLPVSEVVFVFASSFGRDGHIGNDWRTAVYVLLTSRHPLPFSARSKAGNGFKSHTGAANHDHHHAQNGQRGRRLRPSFG